MAPLENRVALERASAILREGKLPRRAEADRIVRALDGMALAIGLAQAEKPAPLSQPEAA